jgi:hypothetical protein
VYVRLELRLAGPPQWGMQVSFVGDDGITDHPREDLEALLARDDGFV